MGVAGPPIFASAGAKGAGARIERVISQSFCASPTASIPSLVHQFASLRARWSSRWCNRHSGDGELVADLAVERANLGKAEVMGVVGFPPAYEAGP
jgi:hypothetical protein